ncbi:MAG: hydroxymethylbilane synthase [Alphaproteobacteria bacterium]|nr:hydroxymethylbilane synthase [Alphaproteobacteria bacterium]
MTTPASTPTGKTEPPETRTLVLGTRGSKLALAQSGQVARAITDATGVPVRLEIIRTRGDAIQDRPLAKVGGKGLFTAELEAALVGGDIDLAVHSLKDLPTEDAPGLTLGCVPRRADPRDVVVGRPLADLPAGSVVGTGSLRRQTQLSAARPDLELRDIRGNVDTRLSKRDDGAYDAIVLAQAGLDRLGIRRDDLHPLSVDEMVPAVGQGALGIQCRAGDAEVLGLLAAIEDAATRRCVIAERAFLSAIGGGCNVPVAAHVVPTRDGTLYGVAVGPDATGALRRVTLQDGDPVALGQALAAGLQRDGA